MESPQSECGPASMTESHVPSRKLCGLGDLLHIPRLRTSASSHDRLVSDDTVFSATFTEHCSPSGLGSQVSLETEILGKQTGRKVHLLDLPEEIQQRILDMLMGELQAPSKSISEQNRVLRNWNSVMRHPRSRKLADLSLVCDRWRRLIQGRIYRHVKIQGTIESIQETYQWFLDNPHLRQHVRHVEFWVPVWQRRGGARDIRDPTSTTLIDMAVEIGDGSVLHNELTRNSVQPVEPISAAYCLSSQKSSLDELFECVADLFHSACILTIEGGHCKRPPMIETFRHTSINLCQLADLPQIQTLVLRGAWNIMREAEHFRTIAQALPHLKEWHCAYTKPKAGGYRSLYQIIPKLPPLLTRLNICLDGFYSQKNICTAKSQDIMRQHHLCQALAQVLPQLEAVTLSGRFCATLFADALAAAQHARLNRLRSVDIMVKNCCRPLDVWSDGAGIRNWGFICAFEQLVTAATRALEAYQQLKVLRISFVDLDACCPALNPYFHLQNGICSGIWSDEILANVAHARPDVVVLDLADSFTIPADSLKDPASYPTRRPRSIKIASYAAFAEGVVL